MINKRSIYAIIPARGGSKRLPNKNILPLAGKLLINYTIEASLSSKYIDKTIVSTDSDKVINAIRNYDVDIIKRPVELATDTATTIDVANHVIKKLTKKPDYIILLQPTSPLRTSKHIDEAFELLVRKNADAVVSVCKMDHSPLWANTLLDNLSMEEFFQKDIQKTRSQDLPIYYRINGAIYICKTSKLFEENTFFIKKNIFAFIMPQECSIDIDEKIDLVVANSILKGF